VGAVIMAAGAAFMWALSAMFMRKVQGVAVYDMQGWIALMTWPALLAWSIAVEPAPLDALSAAGWAGWGGLVYTVLAVSLIGHAALYYDRPAQRDQFHGADPPAGARDRRGGRRRGARRRADLADGGGGAMTLAGVLIITLREGRLRRAQRRLEGST
jgi:O-acetylserine/cysteine efflux transporter